MPSLQPSFLSPPRQAFVALAVLLIFFLPAAAEADRGQPERDRSSQRQRSGSKPQVDNASAASERGSRRGGDRSSAKEKQGGDRSSAKEKQGDLEGLEKSGSRQPSGAQEANIQQLKADLATIGNGMKSAEDEIRTLAQDLQSMAPATAGSGIGPGAGHRSCRGHGRCRPIPPGDGSAQPFALRGTQQRRLESGRDRGPDRRRRGHLDRFGRWPSGGPGRGRGSAGYCGDRSRVRDVKLPELQAKEL